MKSIVETIKENSNRKFLSWFDSVPSLIASFFSVLFALSIVLQLKDIVQGIVLIFLSIFIILFLILNEVIKVKSIKGIYKKQYKANVLPFIITFVLSVGLSGMGIWFWTNKVIEITDNNNLERTMLVKDIKDKHNVLITDEVNKTFENSEVYKSLIKDLDYWKSRKATSSDDLKDIRNRVDIVQGRISSERTIFNTMKSDRIGELKETMFSESDIVNAKYSKVENKASKNNLISYIFLSLILITELAILMLNKFLVDKEVKLNKFIDSKQTKRYLIERNILEYIFIVKTKKNLINISTVGASPASKSLDWDEKKAFYNSLITIGILDSGFIDSKVNTENKTIERLTNKVIVKEDEALTMFDNYYEKIFKYNIDINS